MFRPKRAPKGKPDDDTFKFDPLRPGDQPSVVVTEDGVVARQETDGSLSVHLPDGCWIVSSADSRPPSRMDTSLQDVRRSRWPSNWKKRSIAGTWLTDFQENKHDSTLRYLRR
jgi:hypothetical protein